jgi:hypothetical protein
MHFKRQHAVAVECHTLVTCPSFMSEGNVLQLEFEALKRSAGILIPTFPNVPLLSNFNVDSAGHLELVLFFLYLLTIYKR